MAARRRVLRRVVCGATALVLLAGDLAAASGRLGAAPPAPPVPGWEREPAATLIPPPLLLANPEIQPANPCAPPQERKKKEDPGVPPSVGRDRIERLLRDRQRQDEQMPVDPNVQPPPQQRAPVDEDAVRRLGEQLRRRPGPIPPTAGPAPKPADDPG